MPSLLLVRRTFGARPLVALCSLAFAVLPSCLVSKPMSVDILKPAQFTVPVDVKNVVVVDNAYRLGDSVEVMVNKKKGQYLKLNSDTVATVVLKQFSQSLTERRFFDTVCVYPKPLTQLVAPGMTKPLNYNELRSIQRTCNADAAIVLQGYLLNPGINFNLMGDESQYYQVVQSVSSVFLWVLVDLRTDSVLDTYKQTDELHWTAYTGKYEYPVLGLPTFKESFVSAADMLGFAYADYLTPNWENVERFFYSSSSGYYGEAESFARKYQWERASKIWFGLYQVAKKSSKARLAHNIAFAYEMMGQFEEAAQWAHESITNYNKLSDWYAFEKDREEKYFEILVKRSVDAIKLKEQIGG